MGPFAHPGRRCLILVAAVLVGQRQIVLAPPVALLHLPVSEHVAVGSTDLAAAGDQHRQVLGGKDLVGFGLVLAAIVRIRHGGLHTRIASILVSGPCPVS